jgi:hypothetical protein
LPPGRCESRKATRLRSGARLASPARDRLRDLAEDLSALDFSLLLPDVMTIADEVDWQLTQATDSYMGVVGTAAAA